MIQQLQKLRYVFIEMAVMSIHIRIVLIRDDTLDILPFRIV